MRNIYFPILLKQILYRLEYFFELALCKPGVYGAYKPELFEMGARCTLLTVSPENIEQRLSSRNPNEWVGKTEEEMKMACDLLLEEQQEYRDQAENSVIPTIEINTDNKDWESYAKQIYFVN